MSKEYIYIYANPWNNGPEDKIEGVVELIRILSKKRETYVEGVYFHEYRAKVKFINKDEVPKNMKAGPYNPDRFGKPFVTTRTVVLTEERHNYKSIKQSKW